MSDWRSRAIPVIENAPQPAATPSGGWRSRAIPADQAIEPQQTQDQPGLLRQLGNMVTNPTAAVQEITPESAQATLEHYGQGLSAGYLPQLQAKAQPITDRLGNIVQAVTGGPQVEPAPWSQLFSNDENYVKARDENVARIKKEGEEHPVASLLGTVGGAVNQGLLIPVSAPETIAGGVLKGAGVGAVQGALQNPGDTQGVVDPTQYAQRFGNAASGAAVGGVLGGVGGALASTGKLGRAMGETKPNANEITSASKALGAEPTAGQLSASPTLQGIESSLYQSPHQAGDVVREGVDKVRAAVSNGAQKVADQASKKTAFEVGEQIKSDLIGKIGEQLDPVKAAYQSLGGETGKIKVDGNRLMKVGENLLDHDYALFESEGLPSKIANQLQNVQSVEQLQTLRATLGRLQREAYRTGQLEKGRFLGDAVKSMDRVEQSSIVRAAIDARGNTVAGKNLAQGMVDDIKFARRGYRELMQNIGEMAEFTKVKGQRLTPSIFIDKLESIPSEQLANKMFQTKNVAGLNGLKEAMPEQFESLRQLQIANIVNKATKNDVLDPASLIKNIESYSPEVQKVMFSPEQLNTVKNMKTVISSYPPKMGPSGTPQGMEFRDFGNVTKPSFWMDLFGREAQAKLYQAAGKTIKSGAGAVTTPISKGLIGVGKGLGSPATISTTNTLLKQ